MNKETVRQALSVPSTSIYICAVGLAGGIIAALVIVLFRLCIEYTQSSLLGGVANYSALEDWQLFLLPIGSVLLIVIIAKITGFKHYRLGIPYVIHRIKLHYGHIPLISTVNQFFGGLLALSSGFVVGKEGPSVHLAAATSHYIGRYYKLPFNSLRILAGCGIAAGISAAFNTPFAAVIFVMEVVMREYKVHIFVPVMLSAACGSVITRMVFGDYTELSFLSFSPMPYWQLPLLIVLGAILGALASIFNKQLMGLMRLMRTVSMLDRLLIAAVITGSFAFFMPTALGAEFITIKTFLASSPHITELAFLFIAKFFLAIVAIALGVPGGIIGAVMVIGILAGSLFIYPISGLLADIDTAGANYAILGLAGFLAAVLHAPMAALSAAMELTSTQQVVLPAIITIVSAYVTSKQFCSNSSIFIQQLDYQQSAYKTTSMRDLLQHTGVMALMKTDVKIFKQGDNAEMYTYLLDNPQQIVVNLVSIDPHKNPESDIDMPPENAENASSQWQKITLDVSLEQNAQPIKVHAIDAISDQNTLAEVYEKLYKIRQGGVVIYRNDPNELVGLITWDMLHTYLLRQQH